MLPIWSDSIKMALKTRKQSESMREVNRIAEKSAVVYTTRLFRVDANVPETALLSCREIHSNYLIV
jgi:hypothetical protein